MKKFVSADPKQIQENMIRLISDEWMLVSAGGEERWNTMTASWGGMGCIWNKPSAFIFIRPQRYTMEFLESNENFSLCFFGRDYRKILSVAGAKSGRDMDKMHELGLSARFEDGTVFFDEAKLVLICRKVYRQDMNGECVVDRSIIPDFYSAADYHRMYVGHIVKAYTEE